MIHSGLLLNTFALQNNPVNELKGQIGIILFVFTILCIGVLIGKYVKRKDRGYVTGVNDRGIHEHKTRSETSGY